LKKTAFFRLCRRPFTMMVAASFIVGLIVFPAFAVMPPEIYANASEESKIKAIATIEDVETLNVGERYSSKNVIFKIEYALTKDTPEIFTGFCQSVDTEEQKNNIMVGGNTYFYPHSGMRVFVTVQKNGGRITSMTPLTPELERAIRETPERVRYGINRAYIAKSEQEYPEPVLRGKDPLPTALNGGLSELEALGQDIHGSKQEELHGQLLVALGDDDVEEVARLLKNGAKVNQPLSSSGQAPIMAAESARMATLLIRNGADVKARDSEGGTVLHYAVSREKGLELIPIFASNGADTNARGWGNKTPLSVAIDYFNENKSAFQPEVLFDGPVPVTPEATARIARPKKVLQALITAGADINGTDEYGNTALMNCVVADNADLLEVLLKLGADSAVKDKYGKTARDTAYELGHRYIYQMLE